MTPIVIYLLVAAPCVGSFLGLLIIRLPDRRPIVSGRSACDQCGHPLQISDLFPLASWIRSGGKCRYCKASIGRFYPLIELAAIVVVAWAATAANDGEILIASSIYGWLLLTLALIDWRTYLLPDLLTASLAITGLMWAYFFDRTFFLYHAAAALAGFGAFTFIAWLYRRMRGRQGLGLGDAKLFGAIGAWLSLEALTSVVFLAAAFGLITVLAMSLRGHKVSLSQRLPFGTFLALAGWLVWLYGPLALPS